MNITEKNIGNLVLLRNNELGIIVDVDKTDPYYPVLVQHNDLCIKVAYDGTWLSATAPETPYDIIDVFGE